MITNLFVATAILTFSVSVIAEVTDFRPPHELSYTVSGDGEGIVGQYLELNYFMSESQLTRFNATKYDSANEAEFGYAFNQLGTWSFDIGVRGYREDEMIAQGAYLGAISYNGDYFALDFLFDGERSELSDKNTNEAYLRYNAQKTGIQLTGYVNSSLSLSAYYQDHQYSYDRTDVEDIFLQYLVSNEEGLNLLQTRTKSEWGTTIDFEFKIRKMKYGVSLGHYESKIYLFNTSSVGNDINIRAYITPNWILNLGASASKDSSQDEATAMYSFGLIYRWVN